MSLTNAGKEGLVYETREKKPLWKRAFEFGTAGQLTALGLITLPLFPPGGAALIGVGVVRGFNAIFR